VTHHGAHHVQAVAEAKFDLEGGVNADAQDLAEKIRQARSRRSARWGCCSSRSPLRFDDADRVSAV